MSPASEGTGFVLKVNGGKYSNPVLKYMYSFEVLCIVSHLSNLIFCCLILLLLYIYLSASVASYFAVSYYDCKIQSAKENILRFYRCWDTCNIKKQVNLHNTRIKVNVALEFTCITLVGVSIQQSV